MLDLLRLRDYRWLVAGSTVNVFGSGIAPVALAFAVLDLGGGATELGLVEAAYALANVSAILAGGVWGDRLPRAKLMVGSNGASALVQGTVAAALIGGWASIWLLALLGALNGALSALAGPSSNAAVQQALPAADLARGIAVQRLAKNIAMIGGFALAGLLVAAIGSGGALAIDAATFGLAALAFSRLRLPDIAEPAEARHFLTEAREGLAEVLRRQWLWALILMATCYHLFYSGAQGVLGPIVVSEAAGRTVWGLALAALMAGFMTGGFLCLVWRPRRLLFVPQAALALTACFPAAMLFAEHPAVVLAGAFLHGFGLEIFDQFWSVAVTEQVPPDKLARVYSIDMLGSFVARPLGLAMTGPVVALIGERAWLTTIAVVLVLCGLVPLGLRSVRTLERRQAVEPA